ncbi:hypothetical protein [Lysobacter enzymogenes]|uniref:hypothetical protein n=1 Tax=Lysobacter enzymogenes TaxID=69 RepID=UPI00089821EF|nr:hypothetical protein [Lysobacter enzymogenes]SDW52672.1 hypothetical protein SAMN05421681_102115 [Lysobacter enzymogenes]
MNGQDQATDQRERIIVLELVPDPAHGWVFDRGQQRFAATARIRFLRRVSAYRSPLLWDRLSIDEPEQGCSLGFSIQVMRRLQGEVVFEAGETVEFALDLYAKLTEHADLCEELREFPAGPATLSIGFALYAREHLSDGGAWVSVPIEVV